MRPCSQRFTGAKIKIVRAVECEPAAPLPPAAAAAAGAATSSADAEPAADGGASPSAMDVDSRGGTSFAHPELDAVDGSGDSDGEDGDSVTPMVAPSARRSVIGVWLPNKHVDKIVAEIEKTSPKHDEDDEDDEENENEDDGE